MRTISTLDTRRTVIDAASSPRASFSLSGFRTASLNYYRHGNCTFSGMAALRYLLVASLLGLPFGIAAANNDDDGFIWIDANTRIKVKPVSTTAGGGATAPEKAPKKDEKDEKKEKAKKKARIAAAGR